MHTTKQITRIFLLIVFVTCLGIPGAGLATVGDVVTSFATPEHRPTGLTYDGHYLWLADRKTDTLYQIDPRDGSVKKTLPAPGYSPLGLTWDGTHLWNIDNKEGYLYRINPKTGVAERIVESYSPNPTGLAWDGECLWMADNRRDILLRLNPEDGMMISTIPSPSGDPQGLTFDGKYLWVSDRREDKIYMITPDKGEVIITLHAPGKFARGLAWDGEYLWNVDYQSDKIYKIKINDSDFLSKRDEKVQLLEYCQEFRNYGPGLVRTLDIYMAIPEDRDNQKLLEPVKFTPQPTEILTDKWGQKIAHYHVENLKSGEAISPTITVKARICSPEYYIFPEKVGKLEDIPREIRKAYLVDGQKYQLTDPLIQKLVKEVVGDEKNPYWIARRVYNYVIGQLSYNLKPVGGWNTAPTVLKRGTGSCSEYSFSFIALCRAAGLPARYVGAVSLRGDDASLDEVFHRWCEVYLPNYGWVPFDANKGDKEKPAAQALGIGNIASRYIITTVSGGDSEYLGWWYNFNHKWTSEGKCRIYTEHFGEWSPVEE